jgi:hypothetical protein
VKNKKQNKKINGIFWGIIAFAFGAVLFNFIFKDNEKSLPHDNPIDSQISLHTNKNITPNAVATNPNFKHIAFEARPPENFSYLSQVASVIESLKYLAADWFGADEEKIFQKECGSWVWTPVLRMTPEYMESILAGAQENRIDAIYVSVDSYLDIFVMKDGAEKRELKEKFSKILEDFIIRANQKGIAVDAEAGWQNWAEEGNEYKAFAIVDFVKNFNAARQNKFRGFQYDVESYLLNSYKKNPAPVLKNFVRLVDLTENFIGTSALRFSVVVPDFYDKKDKTTPRFSYNNKKDFVLGHLFKILDERADSSLIVMSYRNFADGKDGAIEVSENEMRTAKRNARNTKIIIAQETGNVLPPYITFHDTSKKYFSEQIEKINSAFDSRSNFGGIAIHYVNAFLALK